MQESKQEFVSYFQNTVFNIEATNYCNMQCKYCSNPKMTYPKGYMSLHHFKIIIDKIRMNYPSNGFEFCGYGEPLCNPEFFSMLHYIKDNNLSCSLVTNGLRAIEERHLPLFSGLTHIRYSLDAVTNEVYNLSRPNVDVKKVIHNIELLIQFRNKNRMKTPKVFVRVNVFRFNKHQVHDVIKICEDMGVDQVHVVRGYSPADVSVDIDEEDYKNYSKDFVKIYGAVKKNNSNKTHQKKGDSKNNNIFPIDHNFFEFIQCPVPTIRWNGDVCPCCSDPIATVLLGNLLKSDMEDLFSKSNMDRMASLIYKDFFSNITGKSKGLLSCYNCDLFWKGIKKAENIGHIRKKLMKFCLGTRSNVQKLSKIKALFS